jgi:hypothetical protein
VNNRLADRTDIQTGYRKNFSLDDVISDRLDLGNNLIVEIRFYVSINDDVIVPNKMSFGSKLKKFLGFNESDFYVRLKGDDLQDELDDLCEQFLAPLSDDGFTYEVRPAWHGEFDIRLSQHDTGNSGSAVPINKLFDYSLVMDRFIPLVRILSRRFELAQLVYFYSTEQWDINKKVFSVEQICADKGPDYLITTVKLTVKGKLQKVVESRKSTTDELKEFSEDCLVYLLDDGFEITTYNMANDDTRIVIWLSKPGPRVGWNNKETRIGFEWDAVKDYVIPFIQLLAKKYRLDKFDTVGSVQYPVRFNYGVDSPDLEDFTYDQIVDDSLFNDVDNEFKHKYTKRGFTSWEKIYTIGVRVKL